MRASTAPDYRSPGGCAKRCSRPRAWNLLRARPTSSHQDVDEKECSPQIWRWRLQHPPNPHQAAQTWALQIVLSPAISSFVSNASVDRKNQVTRHSHLPDRFGLQLPKMHPGPTLEMS